LRVVAFFSVILIVVGAEGCRRFGLFLAAHYLFAHICNGLSNHSKKSLEFENKEASSVQSVFNQTRSSQP